MSITEKSFKLQVDNHLLRLFLNPDDAIYWSRRTKELSPTAEVTIVELDDIIHEAEFSDFEVEEFVAEFLEDETNQIILRTATTEEVRREVLTYAGVYFSQVSDKLLDRLCREIEAAI